MKSLKYYTKEAGVTLVELLVGLSVGIIVVGGILTVYSNTAGSSANTIKGAILNQEMNAIMQLVTNDLRRAGYWLDTNTTSTDDANPFTDPDPDYKYNLTIGTWNSEDCITYAYDLDQDSSVGIGTLTAIGGNFENGSAKEDADNVEIFGFRLNSGSLEMRTGADDSTGTSTVQFNCSNGAWADLNDPDVVTITGFTIDSVGTSCINTSIDTTPNDWTTTGTTTTFCSDTSNVILGAGGTTGDIIDTDAGNTIIEVRQINITLTGTLASDSAVTKSLTRTIRVRNNRTITGLNFTVTVP